MNGNSIEGFQEQIADVRPEAALHGRTVKFAANAFVINRPKFAQAEEQLRDIVDNADDEDVKGFRDAVTHAGRSSHPLHSRGRKRSEILCGYGTNTERTIASAESLGVAGRLEPKPYAIQHAI